MAASLSIFLICSSLSRTLSSSSPSCFTLSKALSSPSIHSSMCNKGSLYVHLSVSLCLEFISRFAHSIFFSLFFRIINAILFFFISSSFNFILIASLSISSFIILESWFSAPNNSSEMDDKKSRPNCSYFGLSHVKRPKNPSL